MNDREPLGKIIIFSGYFLPFLGGIERYTDKLAHELESRGYEVVIVVSNHDLLPEYESAGRRSIYRLPSLNMFKNRYPIMKRNGAYRRLIDDIRAEQADHYICNTRFQLTTLVGAKMAKEMGKRAIIIDHGSSHFTVGNPILDFFGGIYEHLLTSLIKRYVKRYYGVSERCNQWLSHFNIEAAGVFYNAIDADAFNNYENAQFLPVGSERYSTIITYAGRVMKEKGVEILLNSFSEISRKHKEACLVIAGDGPYLKQAQKEFTQQNIFFTGRIDYREVMGLLNKTDIFCHPSMYPEGLPTAVLEAGIMKCAVIATDRGGVKEVITSHEYGIIVEENQDDLSKAMDKLLGDKKLLNSLKINLSNRVASQFTWSNTAEVVIKVLKEE